MKDRPLGWIVPVCEARPTWHLPMAKAGVLAITLVIACDVVMALFGF